MVKGIIMIRRGGALLRPYPCEIRKKGGAEPLPYNQTPNPSATNETVPITPPRKAGHAGPALRRNSPALRRADAYPKGTGSQATHSSWCVAGAVRPCDGEYKQGRHLCLTANHDVPFQLVIMFVIWGRIGCDNDTGRGGCISAHQSVGKNGSLFASAQAAGAASRESSGGRGNTESLPQHRPRGPHRQNCTNTGASNIGLCCE